MIKYRILFTSTLVAALAFTASAQQTAPAAPSTPRMPTPEERAAISTASAAERSRELKALGITAMQPPATAYDIGKPGNANYDESKANPYPNLPALLVMKNGKKVTTAAEWSARRNDLLDLFAENVYGKYPTHIPSVAWKVESTKETTVAGVPAVVKHIIGHVDNSAYSAITVDIVADVVTPVAKRDTKVPVIIGGGTLRPFNFTPRPAAP